MDFGSVGPALEAVGTRKECLALQDHAATHSTMSYRAPELFDCKANLPSSSSSASVAGGMGDTAAAAGQGQGAEHFLDTRRADVWSLGCLLFALLFGFSPFECEFDSRTGHPVVVECGYLRVIGKVPVPPARLRDRKPPALEALARSLLVADPAARPFPLRAVLASVAGLDLAATACPETGCGGGGGGSGGGGSGTREAPEPNSRAASSGARKGPSRRSAKERRESSTAAAASSAGGEAPALVRVEVAENDGAGAWTADFAHFGDPSAAVEANSFSGR
jgi:serine/threonine protein kinase